MENKNTRLTKIERKAESKKVPGKDNKELDQEAMDRVTEKIENDPDFKKHFKRLQECIEVSSNESEKETMTKLADRIKGDPELKKSFKYLKRELESPNRVNLQ